MGSLKTIVVTGVIVFVATAAGLAGAHSLQQKAAITPALADNLPAAAHTAAAPQTITLTDAQLATLVARLSKQTAKQTTAPARVSRSYATRATSARRTSVRATSTTARGGYRNSYHSGYGGYRCWYGGGSGYRGGGWGCW